ncbi:DNA-3-methyladenine glycosylase I [Clostridium sp. WILCCON 0269]|uniref:DNA-3-methyladenine glycosylase I n=1 Tax=Candidatus Clostridium eludens TaxID=3381663 RepID=A0ABW8SJ29_9CLOT
MNSCLWPGKNLMMLQYHDSEWCVPSRDDSYIFEMLTLEGAQSGLSWNMVLSKREDYRRAFHNFDVVYCSKLSDEKIGDIRTRFNVIKNLSKLKSVRNNALAIIKIQLEYGTFSDFLWNYVNFKPLINNWKSDSDIPNKSSLSEQISKDLKKRNFKFVGPITIYSFMQAIGMVDDHIRTCPHHSTNR